MDAPTPLNDSLTESAQPAPTLERKVGLGSAISLNMMNMIGVGPFITLPLVVAAMGGFHAKGVASGERTGGKGEAAQSKGDRKSNHDPA